MTSTPQTPLLKRPALLQSDIIQSNALFQRLIYFTFLTLLKAIITTFLFLTRTPIIKNLLPSQPFSASRIPPTIKKTYPCRPNLENRIFIPKSFTPGSGLLPLYLDVHGGGFALTDAEFDDEFCGIFCNKHNILIVSIEYSKTPLHRFPTQINDIAAIAQAVINDETLPIDKSKIAFGGFSAGGNLVLAVSQREEFRGIINGVVSNYPVTDYTRKASAQVATRPQDSGIDLLAPIMGMLDWGYIPQGHDLRDERISVAFTPREKLPGKLFIVGTELDLMCWDAEMMAERLAKEGGSGNRTGTEVAWEQNGVRWEKILGHSHGMDGIS